MLSPPEKNSTSFLSSVNQKSVNHLDWFPWFLQVKAAKRESLSVHCTHVPPQPLQQCQHTVRPKQGSLTYLPHNLQTCHSSVPNDFIQGSLWEALVR